jgi:hypothetical protein
MSLGPKNAIVVGRSNPLTTSSTFKVGSLMMDGISSSVLYSSVGMYGDALVEEGNKEEEE